MTQPRETSATEPSSTSNSHMEPEESIELRIHIRKTRAWFAAQTTDDVLTGTIPHAIAQQILRQAATLCPQTYAPTDHTGTSFPDKSASDEPPPNASASASATNT